MLALQTGARLAASDRTLAGLSGLSSACVGPGLGLPPSGCRLRSRLPLVALLPAPSWLLEDVQTAREGTPEPLRC